MALILSIETSTSVCSVALHRSGKLIKCKELNESGAHAEKLMLLIEDLIQQSGYSFKNLDAIAVSSGPGSYTGLRIGVSTAKGLAYGLNKPLIGIDTLKALGGVVTLQPGEFVIPVLDARRMEVYRIVMDSNYVIIDPLQAEVLTGESFRNFLEKGRVYFVGDALEKTRLVIDNPRAYFKDEVSFSAAHLGDLAFKKFENSEFEDLAYFVPNYLKEFKALHSKKNPLLSL